MVEHHNARCYLQGNRIIPEFLNSGATVRPSTAGLRHVFSRISIHPQQYMLSFSRLPFGGWFKGSVFFERGVSLFGIV